MGTVSIWTLAQSPSTTNMKFLVLFACVAAASAQLVTYPNGAVAPAKTPEVALLKPLTSPPRDSQPGEHTVLELTDTTDFTLELGDTTESTTTTDMLDTHTLPGEDTHTPLLS